MNDLDLKLRCACCLGVTSVLSINGRVMCGPCAHKLIDRACPPLRVRRPFIASVRVPMGPSIQDLIAGAEADERMQAAA